MDSILVEVPVGATAATRTPEVEGCRSRIRRWARSNRSLSECRRTLNRVRSKVKVRVEHGFGSMANDMPRTRMRASDGSMPTLGWTRPIRCTTCADMRSSCRRRWERVFDVHSLTEPGCRETRRIRDGIGVPAV